MKIIIIGGGPAGMMAAISAKQKNSKNEVIILEKNDRLGKKLLITGKGRCNITSSLNIEDFIRKIPGNGKFLYSVFNEFDNKDIISFLHKQGLAVKEERGNRIFPITDKSIDVLNSFIKKIEELKITVKYNTKAEELLIDSNNEESKIYGVKTNKGNILSDRIIIATGGKSYPLTGSTGDGYTMAKKVGHSITELNPSLVPLEIYEKEDCKKIQGLSLKNIKIQILDKTKNKIIYEDFGEMLFTHFGVSGPIILSSSAHLIRYKNIKQLMKNKKILLKIDLKPVLEEEKLDNRILRDFNSEKNKQYKNSLEKLLPQKLIPLIIEKSSINKEKRINEITKLERRKLVELLKDLEFYISKFRPIEEAIITAGGINIKEINPKNMESKKIKGLYFAGEIIDVDAYTGGFNLQIAYSTGYVAGRECDE